MIIDPLIAPYFYNHLHEVLDDDLEVVLTPEQRMLYMLKYPEYCEVWSLSKILFTILTSRNSTMAYNRFQEISQSDAQIIIMRQRGQIE